MIGIELDEHIDVARGAEVRPQDGPEQGEMAHVMPPAEVGNLFLGDIDLGSRFSSHLNFPSSPRTHSNAGLAPCASQPEIAQPKIGSDWAGQTATTASSARGAVRHGVIDCEWPGGEGTVGTGTGIRRRGPPRAGMTMLWLGAWA